MIKPRCILLDIEGTTSSISFVYDVMFPYVRKHLDSFLQDHWGQTVITACLPLLARDVGHDSTANWLDSNAELARQQVSDAVIKMMDDDVKATGLKQLQGAIWKNGFESGQLVAHVYDDVEPALRNWVEQGIELRIYSSGSVDAQKLFFGHCVAGNLLNLFRQHYDTKIGSKKEAVSYTAIAADAAIDAAEILFVSDVTAELDAARDAGMMTLLSVRPGNRTEPDGQHQAINSFAEIAFEVSV